MNAGAILGASGAEGSVELMRERAWRLDQKWIRPKPS